MRTGKIMMMLTAVTLLASGVAIAQEITPEGYTREQIRQMPPEERRAVLEAQRARWESLSEEERAAAIERRRERVTEQRAIARERWANLSEQGRAAAREHMAEHRAMRLRGVRPNRPRGRPPL